MYYDIWLAVPVYKGQHSCTVKSALCSMYLTKYQVLNKYDCDLICRKKVELYIYYVYRLYSFRRFTVDKANLIFNIQTFN